MDKTETDPNRGERIAKALARAGVGSRRDIERMIAEGRVKMDGIILNTPAILVNSLDTITVDGQAITSAEEARLWRFHKPKAVLTTHKDPQGRATVFDKLPAHLGRVVSVGRLDMNTEGLLLLTNDGELARYLELPSHEFVRRYRVRVYGTVDPKKLNALKDGATIEGVHYGPVEAAIEGKGGSQAVQQAANVWLTVAIREGKNREVRRLMQHMGLHVNRLIRTHYGPFSLGTLPFGSVDRVGDAKLRALLPDFFKDKPSSAAIAEEKKASPAKWARAKPKHEKGVKKRKPRSERQKAEKGDATGEKPTEQTDRPRGKAQPRVSAKPPNKAQANTGGKTGGKAGRKAGGKAGGKPQPAAARRGKRTST